ncbi:DNA ligase [Salmonella phage SPLA5a]|nr:DNA ligase [Salmonella phage SPLA5a]
MFKKLFNWLFAKENETPSKQVRVYDFTTRGPGNDITLRVIGDGEYAEAVVFLDITAEKPEVGDFIVVDLSDNTDPMTFVVETVESVALGISQLTLTRYEAAEDE